MAGKEKQREGGLWKGGHPDDHPVLVLKDLGGLGNSFSERSQAEGPGVMEPSPSNGPGLVLECPNPPARTCLGVDSSVHQQRL